MDELARLMARNDPAPQEVPPDELLLAEILGTARPRRGQGLPWRLTFGVVLATGLVIIAANAIPTAQQPGHVTVAAYFRYPGAPLALCGEPGPRPRKLPKSGGDARRVLLDLADAADLSGPAPLRPDGYSQVTVASSRLRAGDRGGRVRSIVSKQWTPVGDQGRRVRMEYALSGEGDRLVQTASGQEAVPSPQGMAVRSLPTRPDELRDRLLARAREPGLPETYRLVAAIVELHENELVDGPHTAAIWRLLSEQPDLRALGLVTDRRERGGQGFAFDVGETERWVLVADPATGELLSVERVMLRDVAELEATSPCVRDFWAFITRKWVPTLD